MSTQAPVEPATQDPRRSRPPRPRPVAWSGYWHLYGLAALFALALIVLWEVIVRGVRRARVPVPGALAGRRSPSR